jgi:menaquinone-9 beta-reductase
MPNPAPAEQYDVALIGGGLAGLAAAIVLARQGFKVVLLEKQNYPFHKVCGEYLAEESLPFLARLGVPLADLNLPQIQRACFSSAQGRQLNFALRPGGIGLSRYTLDFQLLQLARAAGAEVREGAYVRDLLGTPGDFEVQTRTESLKARVVCGTWGKYSNFDLQLKREFVDQRYRTQAFVGVKYHVQADFPRDLVALHSFPGGYCGISAIEAGKFCMAYLASGQSLKDCGGDISLLEKQVLAQNPHLKSLLAEITPLYERPLVIAQVHFLPKAPHEGHILMAGDTAGMIAPLSGNGMSMALRAAALLGEWVPQYLNSELSYPELELGYAKAWQALFQRRIQTGLLLQRFMRHPRNSDWLIRALRPFPGLVAFLHAQTHGQAF